MANLRQNLRRNFLCIWIAQFPAWVMAQSEPALAARPFVVCEKGQVMAASPLAIDAGVKPGMTAGRAQSRCPQVLIVARDRSREELAWAEVQRALYGLTPQVEPIEPGLVFAGVEAKQALPLIASWNARGGQADDRASAQLVALTAAPGEARCLRAGREAAFADCIPLDVLVLAGISSTSLERLKWFGWKSVGALRILSRRQLEEQIGSKGEVLYHFAQGPKCQSNLRPISTWMPPEELTRHLMFEWPAREPIEWEDALDELLRLACVDLGTRSAQSLEIVAQTPIAPVSARRLLKEPIARARELERPARSALAQALQTLAPLPPVVVGLEVRLGHLTVAAEQATLFEGQTGERALRSNRLENALEQVEMRFGDASVMEARPVMEVKHAALRAAIGCFVCEDPNSPFVEDAYGWLSALEVVARRKEKEAASARRESKRTPLGKVVA